MNENAQLITAAQYVEMANEELKVTLPSGAVFLIRVPNALWYLENTDSFPASLLAKVRGRTAEELAAALTVEERKATADHQRKMIEEFVLQPKIRRPADHEKGEIDPADLMPRDAAFIMNYLTGVVGRDGRPLRPGVAERVADAGG